MRTSEPCVSVANMSLGWSTAIRRLKERGTPLADATS